MPLIRVSNGKVSWFKILKMSIEIKELMIKMVVSAWESYFQRLNKLFEKLSDEQLQKQVAPGRNTGIYLLGHLTAVTDGMLPLIGIWRQALSPAR